MKHKKFFQIIMAVAVAIGLFAPSIGTKPPVINDCTTPSQPVCGG